MREAAPVPASVPLPRFKDLRNPVWVSQDNLRDPSVLKTPEGYYLFYSRFSSGPGEWGNPANWAVACAFTTDFVHFENNHDVSPKGFASPGDVVQWHGRWLLPCQSYPGAPVRLCLSESKDLRNWNLEGPLEIPRQKWTARKFGAPFVWREPAQWVMILMRTNDRDRTTFGLLTSPDGRNWTPLPE
jgi:sucrose-6-phosphate hydrolase SacC (GH32 family)